MEYIAHRINTVQELRKVPAEYGVELDLRDELSGKIYIQHNPFETGEDFADYLKEYHHGTMILNIKSERIEYRVLEMIRKYHVQRYFFLDSSFPMIKQLSDMGERRIALRYSEYEGMDTVEAMAGRIDWIWADTFSCLPLDSEKCRHIKKMGYKICLVSPELQGQAEKTEVYAQKVQEEGMVLDAVCSKLGQIPKWNNSSRV